jgi:Predicted periplasmic solute-binding protein
MKKLVKVAAFLTVLLAVLVIGLIYLVYFVPSSHRRVVTEIPKGLGLKDIALKLEKERVVRDDRLFVLYVFLQNYESELKAGEYEFQAGISLPQIVDKLVRGDVIVRRITIPEGFTINQIADLLEQNNVISGEAFLRKAYDSEFAIKLLGDSVSGFVRLFVSRHLLIHKRSNLGRAYKSYGIQV